MSDSTYQPAVYRKQGGDELVVASGGKITVESGGAIEMGTVSDAIVLATNPGSTVIGQTINITHSAGAGDCDDLMAAYRKVAVSGDGDAGLTVVGMGARAYIGTAVGSDTVASAAYGSQPWVSHYGTGAITAMSGLSAKCDVNTGNFTATTVNAGHFHVEGAATVTSDYYNGVMIEIYPDVNGMDAALHLYANTGAEVAAGIQFRGVMTTALDFDNASTCAVDITSSAAATIKAQILVKTPAGDTGYVNVYGTTGS